MKKEIKNHFAVLPTLVLLVISTPMSLSAAIIKIELNTYQNIRSAMEHNALAKRHENLAREMQAQVIEQEAILMNEKHFSYFGRNKQHVESSKVVRIRGCKKAIKENLAKAAYHREIAAQQGL